MDEWNFWKYATGQEVVIFYNARTDIYIQLWLKFNLDVTYHLGKDLPCRDVDCNLATKNGTILSEGMNLLSQLKASNGTTAHQSSCCGVWAFEPEGSTVVFTIKDRPKEKLVLLPDGLVYFCSTGAMVGMRDSEQITSAERGCRFVDKIRTSTSPAPRPAPKVLLPCPPHLIASYNLI
jgi:hypothetical protein